MSLLSLCKYDKYQDVKTGDNPADNPADIPASTQEQPRSNPGATQHQPIIEEGKEGKEGEDGKRFAAQSAPPTVFENDVCLSSVQRCYGFRAIGVLKQRRLACVWILGACRGYWWYRLEPHI